MASVEHLPRRAIEHELKDRQEGTFGFLSVLGFIVLGADQLEPQPDGSAAYPILVQWGNDGAVHLRCRTDGGGGVTLG